jgi:hypothetical protein
MKMRKALERRNMKISRNTRSTRAWSRVYRERLKLPLNFIKNKRKRKK